MLKLQATPVAASKGSWLLLWPHSRAAQPKKFIRGLCAQSSHSETSSPKTTVVSEDNDCVQDEHTVLEASPEPSWPIVTPSPSSSLRRSSSPTPGSSRGFNLRRLKWSGLKPQSLAVTMLFVLAVILVNYGVENIINYYLGEGPVGAVMCILFGAGVLTYLKLKRIPVSKLLLTGFWN